MFLGWFQLLWNQWTKVAEGFWITPKTSSVFIDTFRSFFRGDTDFNSLAMLYNLTVVLVFFGFSYWVVKLFTKEDENDFLDKKSLILVFVFTIPFLIAYLISFFWVPIFHERFLIPVLPAFIIWVTYSLFRLFNLKKSLSYLIFGLALSYVFFGFQSAEEIMRKTTKPAINYAVKQVLSISGYDDVIIPENKLNFLETKYYVKRFDRNNPVYAYSEDGSIPFYIGGILFDQEEIINNYPEDKVIWVITPEGGFYKK